MTIGQASGSWPQLSTSTSTIRVNSVIAAASLLVILVGTALFLPIEYLGFDFDKTTHEIIAVSPGSVAEKAGLHVGDQILKLYNEPIREVVTNINVVDLIGPRPVPIMVLRTGRIILTEMERRPPTVSFQAEKLSMFLLALICWSTGYSLGVVRQHALMGSPLVAPFWLCIAAVIGSLSAANYTAYPIYTGLVWLVVAVLTPLSIYIHLWFPPRLPSELPPSKQSTAYLFGGAVALNSALALWALRRRLSLLEFTDVLVQLAPLAVVVALAAIGVILWHRYRAAPVAHVRRQTRLIMVACLTVLLIWVLVLIAPMLIPSAPTIHGYWLTLVLGVIPLAYLTGGRVTDLYRLDRIAIRGVVHLITASLGLSLALSSRLLDLSGSATVFAVTATFIGLYRPLQHLLLRLVPSNFGTEDSRALEKALQDLGTTLDTSTLIKTLVNGVQAQFGTPSLAFYAADIAGTNTLTLVQQERMAFAPTQIRPGPLTQVLCQAPAVSESKTLQQQTFSSELAPDEQDLLMHPAVALWCPLRHVQGHLLGLLLVGMRSDLDPYRDVDLQALQRLLLAAALALANSAAYAQQLENEAEIRQLYQQVQQAQDTAASELARQLHDEIINVSAYHNVQALKKLVRQVDDQSMQELIASTLRREQELIYRLRRICEQLHPVGIDDPVGLPMLLNMEVERQGQTWDGQCLLEVVGIPIPVAPRAQYEAFRIAREAISNSIKHANATMIRVHLRYPTAPSEHVQLTIYDNGRNAKIVKSQDDQRGVRYMRESARTAGGILDVHVEPHQSTTIIFTFPTESAAKLP